MTPAEPAAPVTQFNTRLSVRHRGMLRELAAQAPISRTLRVTLEEAIDALAEARIADPRAGLEFPPAKEAAVQFNTSLSGAHRAVLDDLVSHHPLGRLATLRMVTEEAIAALYAARIGEGPAMT